MTMRMVVMTMMLLMVLLLLMMMIMRLFLMRPFSPSGKKASSNRGAYRVPSFN